MKKIPVIILLLFYTNIAFGYITGNIIGGCDTKINTIRADFEPCEYTCNPGYYLAADTLGCVACPAGASCPGGTFKFNETAPQGVKPSLPIIQDQTNFCSERYKKFNAIFKINEYTCNPGYYLPANTDGCVVCPADSYCPGGTYTFNETVTQGITACPTGYDYNTTPGKTDITQCQIHCDAGTWNGEYTQLEYIESTGTQYIDTGQNFMYGDEFFFEYMPVASYSNEDKGYGSGTPLDREITGGGRRSGSNVTMYMKNTNYAYSPTLSYTSTLGKKYTEHWKISTETGQLTSNLADEFGNTYVVTGATFAGNYVSGRTVTLYRDNGSYEYPSRMRIYRTWLKRMDGTMAFDMVPARRNSDGVLGMYDKVTNTFFANAGTGAFIAGDDIAGLKCTAVGAGYWAGASTVNYGSVGTRNACVAPTTTVGYGHGADEAADCGRILHIGDEVVYLRASKKTSPALHVDVDNDGIADFFGNATTADVVMHAGSIHKLKLQVGDTVYSIYDDTVNVGE